MQFGLPSQKLKRTSSQKSQRTIPKQMDRTNKVKIGEKCIKNYVSSFCSETMRSKRYELSSVRDYSI